MMFWEGAGKKTESPCFGLWFDHENGAMMAGNWQFSKPMLAAYRQAVLDKKLGPALVEAIDSVKSAGDYSIGGEHYKRVPVGMPDDHERADLLRYAGLYAHGPKLSTRDLGSPELVEICYQHFVKMAPVQRWLVRLDQGQ
jgi:uncharacterized protein (DUF2461 family)